MGDLQALSNQATGHNGEERRIGSESEPAENTPVKPVITEVAPMVCNINKDAAMLYAKMAAIMSEVGFVSRDGTNTYFKYKFQRADDVYNAVRMAMANHKIAFFASMTDVIQDTTLTKRGETQINTRAIFRFTLACGDSGATITSQWYGEAMDTSDKGINKVATAATKYFLLKTFLIGDPGEIDPDSDSPEPAPKHKPAPPPTSKTEPKAEPDAPQVAYNLSEVMSQTAFMYDHPNHHSNSITAMIEVGEIEASDTTRSAIWKVFMHRCASKPLNFWEGKVMEALTAFREAEGSNVPVGSISQWVKDGGTVEQAWQAVRAYKALEDTPPATAKTGKTEDVPF
jgi:hypothetical protein